MNERIRELAEQADNWSDEEFHRLFLANETPDRQKLFKTKFAELIVRECIKESMEEIVADEEIAQENDPLFREFLKGNNQGVVDAVVRFRNHFGVEE